MKSVCNQIDDRFRVLVVCNEKPAVTFQHSNIEYLEVELPPPSSLQTASIGMPALRIDRGCKYLLGLQHAKSYPCSHIMFFDADDYISNRLVGFVANNSQENGWFFNQGYLYDRQKDSLGLLKEFYLYCGTSHIIRSDLYQIPETLPNKPSQKEILTEIDEYYLLYILGSHRWLKKHFAEQGNDLNPLPFPGAIYHVGHGENLYARSGMLETQPCELNETIRQEFYLFK
ncbi:glycosyltransferase family A protein [Gloeothece verrucosa]|uniref:glycosyltransferase family A protein n=1 Tax=Gloeothece verrucosa TaxID=2546359 RepID=UPI0012FEFAA3|nr:glycosyltransferase family A protein [Gloeothece verrucosa]